jgi:DNA-binding NtrC family response regulator
VTYPRAIGGQESGAGRPRPGDVDPLRRTTDFAPGADAASSLPPEKLRLAKDVAEAMTALIEAAEASAALLSAEGGEDFARRVRAEGGLTNWVRRFEFGVIRRALLESKGNRREAARMLGVHPSTLNSKMKSLGIR